jgi:hypothetical protein
MVQMSGAERGMQNVPPKDLENVNDNLPVEHQLEIIRKWAEQMGYQVVAATLQRALDELETRPK